MIKSTPELESHIKSSGVPVIEITLDQLKNAKKIDTKEIINFLEKKKKT